MKLENIIPVYYFIDVKPFQYNNIFKLNKLLYNNPIIGNICETFYFGKLIFKNNKHDLWDIELLDNYNSNIDALVIKIKENSIDNPQNNKYLVIFQNLTKTINSYGCLWINADNKVKVMHVSIEYMIEDLLQTIIKDINFWPKIKLCNAISDRKYKYNNVEIENLYKEYIENYRCDNYNNWLEMSKKYNLRYKI